MRRHHQSEDMFLKMGHHTQMLSETSACLPGHGDWPKLMSMLFSQISFLSLSFGALVRLSFIKALCMVVSFCTQAKTP